MNSVCLSLSDLPIMGLPKPLEFVDLISSSFKHTHSLSWFSHDDALQLCTHFDCRVEIL